MLDGRVSSTVYAWERACLGKPVCFSVSGFSVVHLHILGLKRQLAFCGTGFDGVQ